MLIGSQDAADRRATVAAGGVAAQHTANRVDCAASGTADKVIQVAGKRSTASVADASFEAVKLVVSGGDALLEPSGSPAGNLLRSLDSD